ncbi:MAG: N-6 DNA methylase [Bacilli bacterium]|nr:N-6 DNA methylase [Bacilli bacterium]
MIKKENVKDLLQLMNYTTQDGNLYIRFFDNSACIMVDLKEKTIKYPDELIVNDRTTSNFEHPENFVVLECVTRLLSKGYFARNLELEPRWQLGRGASGGKADILVKDNNGHEFLIIECKTYGDEFEKAWQKTLIDGDQLFSYAQQIKRTQYLCLYASDMDEGKITYVDRIMTLKDNEDYLKTLKASKRLRYKEAADVKELYKVWKEIYNLEYEETGIFEENIVPYEINKLYSIKDLKSIGFEDTQKKYNEFATILRQHNVSGHENAFDKLINIFLAKIVDEIEHPNNLKFNWKGIAFDDYYQLQDRLQKLYKDGMHEFLNEEVTYIDNKQLNDAFKLFKNDPDATKDKVLEYFRELKFYTNNDFAFIDVHNEELFKQNSEILLKIVKMFQDIKLKTEEQNQFLGDLFEGFLDDGIKQNEGQFFTPLPITRFIISSLPLESIFDEHDDIPKVIDYACGAGHFLNEYASQIKSVVDDEQLPLYYSAIDGIEKEYRLSKVSKVSAFMYGQDNIKIHYGDALINNKDIKNDSYSILIANPPYAVKGFLETLSEDDIANYELAKTINSNSYSSNNSIETFFIERAKQLLKQNGVAGIILPSSILTNGNTTYVKTREIILKNFDIVSIVELPSGTFGATGTPTIALFLKKKDDNPSIATHLKNRVDSWFENNFSKDKIFEDKELLIDYLELQNIDIEDYKKFISGTITDSLKKNEMFSQYLNDKKIKDIKDILSIEKDKLYYYMLAKSQNNKVVVVNAPTKNDEIKDYLGYTWSTRKGSEGIKYIGAKSDTNILDKNQGINSIQTPLFNPNDLKDPEKINTIIRNNFAGQELDFDYDNVHYYNLTDLLDFKTTSFTKLIKTANIRRNIVLKDGYQLYNFSNTKNFDLNIGKRVLSTDISNTGKIPVYSANVNEVFGYMDETLPSINEFKLPSVLWGIDGDWNVGYIPENEKFYPTDHCGVMRVLNNDLLPKYVMYALEYEGIQSRFSRSNRASTQRIRDLIIQAPNIKTQNDIVKELDEYDNNIKLLKKEIKNLNESINLKFNEMFVNKNYPYQKINTLYSELYAGGDTPIQTSKKRTEEYKYPIYSNGTKNMGLLYYSKEYKTDKEAITISARGTIGYTQIRKPYFTAVVRLIVMVPNEKVNIQYLKSAIDNMDISKTGNGAGQLTVPDFANMSIILPEKSKQDEFSKFVSAIYSKLDKLENDLYNLDNKKEDLLDKYFN